LQGNVTRGSVDPKTVLRERPPDNPEIRLEMNKIAEKRRRFGYPTARQAIAQQSAERGALASCWSAWA
jgi:hypothetical protein